MPCTPFYSDQSGTLPAPLNIPHSANQGDPVTPWMPSTVPSVFSICIKSDSAQTQGAGDAQHYLYVRGEKGPLTKAANLTISVDGTSYRVFTNDALEAVGVGYIARWRVSNQFGTSGQWRTFQAGGLLDSPDPATAGIPFWRNQGDYRFTNGNVIEFFSPFDSFGNWLAYATGKASASRMYVVIYGVELEVRYVMLVDANTVWDAKLDPYNSGDIEVNLVTIRPHPTSYGVTRVDFKQTFKINLQPYGTCTTPSVQETTVNFNTLFASDIPDPGDAISEQIFNLTLTECPRINIGYYLHANGKWVDGNQGIVGLSGSTPNANPVIGNPRGFGIQLFHNGGQGGTGPVSISPDMNDANKTVYWHTWPGVDAVNDPATGVTHTIPLRTRVIRTSPASEPIQSGPFNTSLIFVIQYP